MDPRRSLQGPYEESMDHRLRNPGLNNNYIIIVLFSVSFFKGQCKSTDEKVNYIHKICII